MLLSFDNVSVLGISQKDIKFDSDFVFRRENDVSISGSLVDLLNSEGVKSIIEQGSGFFESPNSSFVAQFQKSSICLDLNEIEINGESYGEGYVDSFEISGDSIQVSTYQAVLKIYKEGNFRDLNLDQGESTKLAISSSGLSNEDFTLLNDLQENFDFSIDSNEKLSISHNISCSFNYKQSLISKNNNLWTYAKSTASIQPSKLKNLNNRGKRSIKVNASTFANISVTLPGGDYYLIVDYLGQNSTNPSSSQISVTGTGVNVVKNLFKANVETILFTLASDTNILIKLIAGSSDSFFDNIEVHKAEDMPIQKSRKLARFLLDNSPNYSLITEYSSEYKNLNLFNNDEERESFDDLQLTYSLSKNLEYNKKTDEDYVYDVKQEFNYNESGYIQISEKISIEIIESKTSIKLKNAIDNEISKSYARCQDLIDPTSPNIGYKDYLNFSCNGFGFTGDVVEDLDKNNLHAKPVSITTDVNEKEGIANVNILYSDDPSYENSGNHFYRNEYSTSIDNRNGNTIFTINGNISGYGESLSTRNSAVQQAIANITQDANISLIIEEYKTEMGFTSLTFDDYEKYVLSYADLINHYNANEYPDKSMYDYGVEHWNAFGKNEPRSVPASNIFNKISQSIDLNSNQGSASYSIIMGTSDSLRDSDDSNKVKNFEINVTDGESTEIFSDFVLNCQNWAQDLNKLFNPKTTVVDIQVDGYSGQSFNTLYSAAIRILKRKNLYRAEKSQLSTAADVISSNEDEYLIDQSISFSERENQLKYQRTTITLECDDTAQIDASFGFGRPSGWQTDYVASPVTMFNYAEPNLTFNPTDEYEDPTWPDFNYTRPSDPVVNVETVCIGYASCNSTSFNFVKVDDRHDIDGFVAEENLFENQTFLNPSASDGSQCVSVYWLNEDACPSDAPGKTTFIGANFGQGWSKTTKTCQDDECQAAAASSGSFGINFQVEDDTSLENLDLTFEKQEQVPEETFIYKEIYLPPGWSGKINEIVKDIKNVELVSGKKCFGVGVDRVKTLSNASLDRSVCSCQGESIEGVNPWESFEFYMPKSEEYKIDKKFIEVCETIEVDVPFFWDGTIRDLLPNASLVGYSDSYSTIKYNKNNEINLDNYLIIKSENNETHPNFNAENKTLCYGKLYFKPNYNTENKSCSVNIINKTYNHDLIFLEGRSNGGLGLQYAHEWIKRDIELGSKIPTNQGCLEIVGWGDCFGRRFFNRGENYIKSDDIIEHCRVFDGCQSTEGQDCSKYKRIGNLFLRASDKNCNWDGNFNNLEDILIY